MSLEKYKAQLKESENKKNKLLTLKNNLTSLIQAINDIPNTLKNSEMEFETGGYNDGETLDRGILKTCYESLDSVINNFSSIISSIDKKIKKIEKDILFYKMKIVILSKEKDR